MTEVTSIRDWKQAKAEERLARMLAAEDPNDPVSYLLGVLDRIFIEAKTLDQAVTWAYEALDAHGYIVKSNPEETPP